MKEKTITKALIDHHNEMRKLVKEIKKDAGKFIFLKKHLDIHHELEEEEEDLFPEAEKALSEKEQTGLGARFEELKKQRLEAALETKPVKELEKPKTKK